MGVTQVIKYDTCRQINIKLGYLYPGLGYSKKAIAQVTELWWERFRPTLALTYREQLVKKAILPCRNFSEFQLLIRYFKYEGLTEREMLEKVKVMLER